jgi:hypothetical protein
MTPNYLYCFCYWPVFAKPTPAALALPRHQLLAPVAAGLLPAIPGADADA